MLRYEDLTRGAKLNCLEQYVNVLCAYSDDLEECTMEELEQNVVLFLEACSEEYELDNYGNWYWDGVKVEQW